MDTLDYTEIIIDFNNMELKKSDERLNQILEKWYPVICTDEEYKIKYGKERPKNTTTIIIEGQESCPQKFNKCLK